MCETLDQWFTDSAVGAETMSDFIDCIEDTFLEAKIDASMSRVGVVMVTWLPHVLGCRGYR